MELRIEGLLSVFWGQEAFEKRGFGRAAQLIFSDPAGFGEFSGFLDTQGAGHAWLSQRTESHL
jgi:hypothetical protein